MKSNVKDWSSREENRRELVCPKSDFGYSNGLQMGPEGRFLRFSQQHTRMIYYFWSPHFLRFLLNRAITSHLPHSRVHLDEIKQPK